MRETAVCPTFGLEEKSASRMRMKNWNQCGGGKGILDA